MTWQQIRQLVLKRDNYTCQRCGAKQTPEWAFELNIHHIIPLGSSGTDNPDNLIAYCNSCHGIMEPRDLKPNRIGIGRTIRVTDEAHKALIRLSTSKVETFSDVIMKLVDYYDKGHP